MRQFTMNIDDGLLLAVKARALQAGCTVSDIVRDLLSREVGYSAAGRPEPFDDGQALPVLAAYSAGQINRKQAMAEVGLRPDQYLEFRDAMCRLSVDWPAIDRRQAEREGEVVARAIADACDES